MDFDWDDDNIEHLAWHEVEPEEAQDVFYNDRIEYQPYIENGENRQNIVGRTDAGRLLKVIFTLRGGKVRVCSAYTPGKREIEAYKRRFKDG